MLERLSLIFLLVLTACVPHSQGVYQYAVFDDFAAGQYAGTIPLSALKTHGDFGLGTFHGLDGEMIVLDGVIYRADASCSLSRPGLATLSPFAELVFFKPEASSPVAEPGDLAALAKWLDAKLPPGTFAAARVKATIKHLKIRSVPGFSPPYPPLEEAITSQHIRELTDASGTLVGLRGPAKPGGVWVPGWHFHFVSADGHTGGHILNARGIQGDAAWMTTGKYALELPPARQGSPDTSASPPTAY